MRKPSSLQRAFQPPDYVTLWAYGVISQACICEPPCHGPAITVVPGGKGPDDPETVRYVCGSVPPPVRIVL